MYIQRFTVKHLSSGHHQLLSRAGRVLIHPKTQKHTNLTKKKHTHRNTERKICTNAMVEFSLSKMSKLGCEVLKCFEVK